jgi:hypothetical protein
MWTCNDMSLCPLDAAEQFARDCFPGYGRVLQFSGNDRAGVWSFSIGGISGTFNLTRSTDLLLWIANVIPSPEFAP